jgi:hypothetical protein
MHNPPSSPGAFHRAPISPPEKGFTADIFASYTFGRDGLSVLPEGIKTVTILDGSLPAMHSPDERTPAVRIVRREIARKLYVHAEPVCAAGKWLQFGGRFLWCHDSRFRDAFGGPVPLHDRCENP